MISKILIIFILSINILNGVMIFNTQENDLHFIGIDTSEKLKKFFEQELKSDILLNIINDKIINQAKRYIKKETKDKIMRIKLQKMKFENLNTVNGVSTRETLEKALSMRRNLKYRIEYHLLNEYLKNGRSSQYSIKLKNFEETSSENRDNSIELTLSTYVVIYHSNDDHHSDKIGVALHHRALPVLKFDLLKVKDENKTSKESEEQEVKEDKRILGQFPRIIKRIVKRGEILDRENTDEISDIIIEKGSIQIHKNEIKNEIFKILNLYLDSLSFCDFCEKQVIEVFQNELNLKVKMKDIDLRRKHGNVIIKEEILAEFKEKWDNFSKDEMMVEYNIKKKVISSAERDTVTHSAKLKVILTFQIILDNNIFELATIHIALNGKIEVSWANHDSFFHIQEVPAEFKEKRVIEDEDEYQVIRELTINYDKSKEAFNIQDEVDSMDNIRKRFKPRTDRMKYLMDLANKYDNEIKDYLKKVEFEMNTRDSSKTLSCRDTMRRVDTNQASDTTNGMSVISSMRNNPTVEIHIKSNLSLNNMIVRKEKNDYVVEYDTKLELSIHDIGVGAWLILFERDCQEENDTKLEPPSSKRENKALEDLQECVEHMKELLKK